MTPLALALVVASAGAHATWNYLAKSSQDKQAFTWCFTALASVIYLPLVIFSLSRGDVPTLGWLFVVGTMLLHVGYFTLLGAAYSREDLAVVYPVARGVGVALVAIVASVALAERISPAGAVSIAAIIVGVLLAYTRGSGWSAIVGLVRSFRSPGSQLALLTGVVIAAYSVWDKQGVMLVSPTSYIYFVFLGPALAGAPFALRRPQALRREIRDGKAGILGAAILSPLAYLLVLSALSFSHVSYVAAAREIGIVFGAVLGTVLLGEPHGRNRLLGSVAIVAGVIGLTVAA